MDYHTESIFTGHSFSLLMFINIDVDVHSVIHVLKFMQKKVGYIYIYIYIYIYHRDAEAGWRGELLIYTCIIDSRKNQ